MADEDHAERLKVTLQECARLKEENRRLKSLLGISEETAEPTVVDRYHQTVVDRYHQKVRQIELIPALIAGKDDIAAGNLTITPHREAVVDFTAPVMTNVRELVLTGPASPTVSTLDDLAGKEVFVRKSTSYYEHLVELNKRFAAENKPSVKLKEAPDELETDDLIEMLNAGLIPMIVADKHIADFWAKVFPKIVVHDAIAVHTGGEIGWAIRKGSPHLKAFLDEVAIAITQGNLKGALGTSRGIGRGNA